MSFKVNILPRSCSNCGKIIGKYQKDFEDFLIQSYSNNDDMDDNTKREIYILALENFGFSKRCCSNLLFANINSVFVRDVSKNVFRDSINQISQDYIIYPQKEIPLFPGEEKIEESKEDKITIR